MLPLGYPILQSLGCLMAGIDFTPGKRGSDDTDCPVERSEHTIVRSGKPRQRTIRFRLACLVLACVLPVCVIAGFVVYYAYQQKRNLLEERALETARALSMVVDQELAAMQASTTALATSPVIVSGNCAAFHNQAQAVLHDYPGGSPLLWRMLPVSSLSTHSYLLEHHYPSAPIEIR